MSSSSPQPESWISAFCALVGHEYFAEVSEDFIEDDFNLTGLQSQVPMYKEALEMILDVEPEDASDEEEEEDDDDDDDEDDDEMQDGGEAGYRRAAAAVDRRHLRIASDLSVIESSAEMLYGLIHQRFITSRAGIQQMAEKYEMGHFGFCPRVYCYGAKVLPVGCSDIPGQETVKLFCPSCLDIYTPPNSRFQTVDGAFFGTTFGCLFFMTFPEMNVGGTKPVTNQDPSPSSSSSTTNAAVASSSSTNPQNGAANGLPQSASNANRSLSSSLTSQPQFPASQQHQISNSTSPLPPQPTSINGVPPKNLAPGLGPGNVYEPRIYGFRVSEFAKTGPRMKWLRSRPLDVTELDECRLWAETVEVQALEMQQQQRPHGPGSGGVDDAEMVDRGLEEEELEEQEEEEQRAALDGQAGFEDEEEEDDAGVRPDEDLNAPEGLAGAEVREVAARKKASTASSASTSRRRTTTADGLPNGGGGTAVRVGDGG